MSKLEDKIVWGGLYKVNHRRWDNKGIRNDQVYYQAVPCMRKDGTIWMQDTHQIRSSSMKKGQTQTEAAIERIFELKNPISGDWTIRCSRGDWYHDGNEELTEDRLADYELICDLHDYRPFEQGEDYRDFDTSDILFEIHLYSEHGYSWDYGDIGVKLVKKTAQPKIYNKFLASISDVYKDCHRPYFSRFHYDDMIELHKELVDSGQRIHPKEQLRYENAIWLSKRLKEMQKEIDDYFENHKYLNHYDYENSGTSLESIHPDIRRYLENDCYCPHEIYDVSGFSYQLFYPESPCKLIVKNSLRCAVICKSSPNSEPQILFFWFDDKDNPNKIIAAQRVDVTENNIRICKYLVQTGIKPENLKVDEYSGYDYPEDINNLINSI